MAVPEDRSVRPEIQEGPAGPLAEALGACIAIGGVGAVSIGGYAMFLSLVFGLGDGSDHGPTIAQGVLVMAAGAVTTGVCWIYAGLGFWFRWPWRLLALLAPCVAMSTLWFFVH